MNQTATASQCKRQQQHKDGTPGTMSWQHAATIKIKAIMNISIRTKSNTLTASLSRWIWDDHGVSALWCLSHICTHTYACTCACIHTHTHTHTQTHTHTHRHTHTHTHTCARTHIHTLHANCPLQCYCPYMCLETSINQTHIRSTQVYTCTQHWNDISISHTSPQQLAV